MKKPECCRSWISSALTQATGCTLALAAVFFPPVVSGSSAQAQSYTENVLYSFANGPDGNFPCAGLVQDANGNLYGTTSSGGAFGHGTIFKVDAAGQESVLYNFTGTNGDGAGPLAGLALDAQGNLYGTTYFGGISNLGTVFKLDTAAKETVLYRFGKNKGDGANPAAGLVMDAHGNLYGTTARGGDLSCDPGFGCGTVFKIMGRTGKETVLHTFTRADGARPVAGLTRDRRGNMYGTTSAGGDLACFNGAGCGTVFKLDATGKETVLHSFTGGTDGAYPRGGLVMDAQGNLYGTTSELGGACTGGNFGCGTVFKVNKVGNETVLHSFTGIPGDGANAYAGLVRDAQGNLYGTTLYGGTVGWGTVFKVDASGNETVLYNFTEGAINRGPEAALVRDEQGSLYGTVVGGGGSPDGMVFKLTPP